MPSRTSLQVVFSGISGYFVAFAKYLVGDFATSTYFSQLLVPVGLSLYLGADIVPMPMEGMTQAITKKLVRFPFSKVKTVEGFACVLLTSAVSLSYLGRLDGVREGTVIAALVTGKVRAIVEPGIKRIFQRFTSNLMSRSSDAPENNAH